MVVINKGNVKAGDIVLVHEFNWNCTRHIGEPYKALVLWEFNNQPLITKLGSYKPYWSGYQHIVKVVDHIDLNEYVPKER